MATKTNINLIVNGAKVHTRKVSKTNYTHAIVARFPDNTFRISNCSSKGIDALQREIQHGLNASKWMNDQYVWAVERVILPIIDNTVTLNA
jgi:hypothetical protein